MINLQTWHHTKLVKVERIVFIVFGKLFMELNWDLEGTTSGGCCEELLNLLFKLERINRRGEMLAISLFITQVLLERRKNKFQLIKLKKKS